LIDGEPATLELERFEVWADNAEIKVFGENGKVLETLTPPAAEYYRGSVAGQPDSLAFVSVMGDRVEGIIYAADRKFALGSRRVNATRREVIIEESSITDDIAMSGEGFMCELENAPVLVPPTRPRAGTNAAGEVIATAALTGTQRSVINLAVDTDYELFVNAGSNTSNVTTFIGNLIGAASTIYTRDLLTEIRLSYLGIQSSASDPFTIVPGGTGTWNGTTVTYTTMHALLQLGDRWHLTPPSTNARSAATLISGKSPGSGIAWVGTLCQGDIAYQGHWGGAYSYCGGIDPPNDLSVPNPNGSVNYVAPSSNYWPLLQLTHELGHNVGSSHTHCITLTPAQKTQYNVTRNTVDECYSGEANCFSGTQVVPLEKGTIMSYCHLRGPGYGSNTRFTFGQPNEASEVVRNNMRGNMAGKTPSMSAISAPGTLASGATGNASVPAVAGLTYSWQIANGTITSATNTAAITFTGSANPISLRVTATNSTGCSITDSVTVSFNGTALAAPANFVAGAVSATSIAMSWSAVSGATGYQIFRSANGTTYDQIGTTSSTSYTDLAATNGVAYMYRVRAHDAAVVTGPYSNADLATGIAFTDPTLTTGVTKAKLAHFTELLTAVNAVRTLAGLGAISFSAPAPALNVGVRKAHIDNLRDGLNAARAALSLGGVSYTDPTITAASTGVKAVHISDLRNGVR
ncbi:MAG TPA: M12 family metallo-peptidase, partial [Thermoanaerobaculia bacterium]|nr:M12 family metallo-peptidase [Thermoanaerobaculia bacterium]